MVVIYESTKTTKRVKRRRGKFDIFTDVSGSGYIFCSDLRPFFWELENNKRTGVAIFERAIRQNAMNMYGVVKYFQST